MEVLAKLFDITKLPSKFFAWAALLSGLIAFLPQGAIQTLHLQDFPADYKSFAGITFVGSTTFLIINLVLFLWGHVLAAVSRSKRRRAVHAALSDLDFAQVSVLREFVIQGQHVIELPVDHPTVAGLINRGVVQRVSNTGYRDIAGSVFPVQLSSEAKGLVTFELLNVPRQPSEDDVKRIKEERPIFIGQIARTDRQRAGIPWGF